MKPFTARSPFITGLIGMAVLALGAASVAMPSAASTRPVGPALAGPIHQVHPGAVRRDMCGTPKTETINTAGGKFKLPPCGGTSGKVTYASNNAPSGASVTLTAYTSNPSSNSCGSASGETTLAWVTASSSGMGAVTYGTTNKKSSLKNAAFPPSATFTLYAYAFGAEQFHQSLGSPNSHGVLKFASPLNGRTIPFGIQLCFELDTP